MRILIRLLYFGILISCVLIYSTPAAASVLYVGSGGYSSIQSAVNASFSGDTVVVAPGLYNENLIVNVSDLLLVSEEFQTTGIVTKDFTQLNANGLGSAVKIMANGVVFKGFTVHNYTAGISIENCSAVIDNCIIYNTGVTGVNPRGIDAYLAQSSQAYVEITNNEIYDNTRSDEWLSSGGRGINVSSNKAGELCTVFIDNNTIYGNDQRGISVAHISATITNNFLHDNGVYYKNRNYNVGIVLAFNKGNVLIQDNTIINVQAGNPVYAGGIYLFADTKPGYGYEPGYYGIITIDNNIIDTGSCAPGISLNGPNDETFDIYITNNTISGTTVIPWSLEELGGLYVWNMNTSYIAYVDVIENNTLTDNNIGLFVRRTDVGSLRNNNIYGNDNFGAYYHKKAIQGYLDATFNWWGDESGPSGGVGDPLTGTPAEGNGDSISANILFDPWLQAPYSEFIPIQIDIKPGSDPNSINIKSKGRIPVAVLSTPSFDAVSVDTETVRFGRTGSEAPAVHSALEDIDADGDLDLIFHFKREETGIQCGDSVAYLTGKTFSNESFEGSDTVKITGCK